MFFKSSSKYLGLTSRSSLAFWWLTFPLLAVHLLLDIACFNLQWSKANSRAVMSFYSDDGKTSFLSNFCLWGKESWCYAVEGLSVAPTELLWIPRKLVYHHSQLHSMWKAWLNSLLSSDHTGHIFSPPCPFQKNNQVLELHLGLLHWEIIWPQKIFVE